MSEKMPPHELSPEEVEAQEKNDQADYWVKIFEAEMAAADLVPKPEIGGLVREFNTLIDEFEAKHSVDELLLVDELTTADAPNHPVREPARNALLPILNKLNSLKGRSEITHEQYLAFEAKYKRFSRAVGIINNNKVDHTR